MTAPDNRDHSAHYSMLIEWSDEDAAYIVTVPELPGCITHGSSYADAVQQGEDAIATWLETARASGDPISPPRVFSRRPLSAG